MDKQIALSLANADITNAVAMARQAGKPEAEVVKFEQMCNAVISKGAALPDAFFASIKSSASGRDIFRSIHAA